MNDFSVDKRTWLPSQLIDGNLSECVGLTICNMTTNKTGMVYDSDFTYAMGFRLLGQTPNTIGLDSWAGMQSAIAYGLLPAKDETITALQNGALYVANWQNYPQDQRDIALQNVRNGAKRVSLDFDTVLKEIAANREGVALGMVWYASFMLPADDGRVPAASGATTQHMVCATGQVTIQGEVRMEFKPWLGTSYGNAGFGSLSRAQFYQCVNEAFAFDDSASRWISLLGIAITKYPYLQDYVTELMALENTPVPPTVSEQPPVDIEHSDVLYPDWNTKGHARHNVRALCDLEGLTLAQKNVLTACVAVESGFDIHAINKNIAIHSDGTKYVASTDYGICQWNNYYHGDEITPDQALHNPEMAVRLMCKYWRQGLQRQWVSYTSGLYKHYL